MFEPSSPITIYARFTPYPAFLLASDEGQPLSPGSVILRHRHLQQQQRIIQNIPAADHAGAKPTRGRSLPPAFDKLPARSSPPKSNYNTGRAALDVVAPPSGPVTLPPAANAGAGGSGTRASIPPISPNGVALSDGTHLQASPAPSRSGELAERRRPNDPTEDVPKIRRCARGIRSKDEKTVWFSSTSCDLLTTPPDLSAAQFGDLYIHTRTDGAKQAWLRDANSQWISIEPNHPHPYLKRYILNFCANGEPSWVTEDTARTYKGRAKKRDKDQAKGKGDSSVGIKNLQ